MPTPSQRSFFLRHRSRILAGYGFLLLVSWCLQALLPPGDAPLVVPSARGKSHGILLLVDTLQDGISREVLESVPTLKQAGWSVRAPALPGLNTSTSEKVTFESLAEWLAQTQEPAVVLANGHAGAVALHLATKYPENVEALILVDASGVQEFAMLGEYHLNFAMYAVSDGLLALADYLIPHFGAWETLCIQRSQTQLLRRSDRRTLRPLLGEALQPTLILQHAVERRDTSQAREHARLIPQSRIRFLDPDQPLEPIVKRFLVDVEHGAVPGRHEADPNRKEESRQAFQSSHRPRPHGGGLVLLLLGIAIATLVSEDLTCAVTGLMIANGNLTWAQGVGACMCGILFGDYLLFWAGRIWGRPALGRIPLRWMIDPLALRETEQWYKERAGRAILVSRCIPGTRLPAYVAAGLLGVPVRVFTGWFVLAALIWTPLFISVAMLLAEQALAWLDRYHHIAPALMLLGILIYLGLTQVFLPCLNWRGRRMVFGRWQRLWRSEYWPTWSLYTPVVGFLLIRLLKKGNRLMDFTACNPCIPGGGVVEESKSRILDQISERSAVAPYTVLSKDLSSDIKLERARDWMRERGTGFPVVVKPDTGQRGEQVSVVRNENALAVALSAMRGDTMLQQCCAGEEFGMFFIRPPRQETGFIFGMTRKVFPVLTGDGTHTLEDLILADNRAVCQARMFFRQHENDLYSVPKADERIPLTDIGNHARGTQFREGSDLITPALTAAANRIAASLDGFHYGRFDLFAPDEDHLKRGEGLQVIELNGVTSESTNLYDPDKAYPDRVRILLRQWGFACAIGGHQRSQGVRALPFGLLIRQFDRYRKRRHRILLAQVER